MKLSSRMKGLEESATLAVTARAKAMKSKGIDVVSLSAGEPDFNVPDAAVTGVLSAISEGKNRYTPVPGIPELRAAVAGKLARDNGLTYAPEEVAITVGAKQALANALLALLEPGDEVLVPSPFWVSYPSMIRLAGGVMRTVPCSAGEGYRLDPRRVAAACSERTRVLLLNSPNNPSGAVIPEEDLRSLAALAEERDLFVLSDEIYEKLVFGHVRHVSIAALSPALRQRTLVVNGFSKAYAMPGWRLGYAAGPKPLIQAMSTLQGHTTSNAPSLVQYAALAALAADDAPIRAMRDAFETRRDFVVKRLRAISGLVVPEPQGAFYVLPDCSAFLPSRAENRDLKSDTDLAYALLEIAHVAAVPGQAFGAPGCLRFSYAASMEDLAKGMDRVETFLRGLEKVS